MPKLPVQPPTVVAFLQNMWFRDPARMEKIYARYIEREEPGKGRQRFIRDFLFFGCLTGRRLVQAFAPHLGEDFRWQIVWEESAPGFGSYSGANLGYSVPHMRGVLETHKPEIVLLFGKVAQAGFFDSASGIGGLERGLDSLDLIVGPHPAARGETVPNALAEMASKLKELLCNYTKS